MEHEKAEKYADMLKGEGDPFKKVNEMMSQMQEDIITSFPAFMRFNYILNNIARAMNEQNISEDEINKQVNWEKVNMLLTKNLKDNDFNVFGEMHAVSDLKEAKSQLDTASFDIGVYRRQICKDCGNEFYMTKGEIDFFENKKLHLPVRCRECREQRRRNA